MSWIVDAVLSAVRLLAIFYSPSTPHHYRKAICPFFCIFAPVCVAADYCVGLPHLIIIYGRLLQVEGKLFCIRDKWHAWLSFFFLSKVNFIFWCLLQEDLDRGWDDLWPKMATTPAGALETKVDLRLACKNLKNKDIGSKSDPLVAVYQQDRDTWMEVGNNTQWQCLLLSTLYQVLPTFFTDY